MLWLLWVLFIFSQAADQNSIMRNKSTGKAICQVFSIFCSGWSKNSVYWQLKLLLGLNHVTAGRIIEVPAGLHTNKHGCP